VHIHGDFKKIDQVYFTVMLAAVGQSSIFFAVKFKKNLQRKLELKLLHPSNLLQHYPTKSYCSIMQLYSTVN